MKNNIETTPVIINRLSSVGKERDMKYKSSDQGVRKYASLARLCSTYCCKIAKSPVMKIPYILLLMFTFCSCSSVVDFNNLNQRNLTIINEEKISLIKLDSNLVFETDTMLNFKSISEIKEILGEPTSEIVVGYNYPMPNILWILEGPFGNKIKSETVLKLEWIEKKRHAIRIVLFTKHYLRWISIANLLYDEGLEY